MHFDDIIIGGGLSGLVCGLRLQRAGRRCALVSTGQNAMHFSSGSFGLLGRLPDGTPVEEPLKAIPSLPQEHPYSKIGQLRMKEYMHAVKPLFSSCGVQLCGEEEKNSYMLSPTGTVRTAWLALSDVSLYGSMDFRPGEKALIVNLKGYLDFNTRFIAEGLEKKGMKCRIEAVELPEMERLRSNPSEMRSVNIARVMDKPDVVSSFAAAVQSRLEDEDTVVLPSVFGLGSGASIVSLRETIPANIIFVGTMPPSVPGIRSQLLLKKAFEAAGGTYLGGDKVTGAKMSEGHVESIFTENLGNTVRLEADNYILASGSFFSRGLWATPEKVLEPVFGLDVCSAPSRMDWYEKDFFATQEYIGFGVETDKSFHPSISGRTIDNLYASGSVIGGCNTLRLSCGAGVAIMTAFAVSDYITGK
ncbi:MAG: anaerobic glycerol-3-phosphate dehydrogenase subunit B [Bacteroidales bacterium]|nr:anaerobic glycerol-3-phosphate dehydrogenase subunit B [Bacteroidales bacterium]